MTHPLPPFPPLFPPQKWWRHLLEALLSRTSEKEAIESANEKSGLKAREWLRFMLRTLNGEEMMVSLPVNGGASVLKNHPSAEWYLPMEDKSFRLNIEKSDRTIATLYGSTPYFSLLSDSLSLRSITEKSKGRVDDACSEAYLRIRDVLGVGEKGVMQSIIKGEHDDVIRRVTAERIAEFDADTSILDIIFHRGPEAIFSLVPPF